MRKTGKVTVNVYFFKDKYCNVVNVAADYIAALVWPLIAQFSYFLSSSFHFC